MAKLKLLGQMPDQHGKCKCQRCNKLLTEINYYTFKDGSKFTICKPCLTAHIDNFNPETFLWILEKVDVPFVEPEWNSLRDKAFAKDPYKMNGMSVFGKYLSKMKLKQWNKFGWADSEKLQQEAEEKAKAFGRPADIAKEQLEQMEEAYKNGEISEAQYLTYAETHAPEPSAEVTQPAPPQNSAYPVGGDFEQVELIDVGAELTQEDKVYLAMKWGRLYKADEWVAMEKLYNEFKSSFDIQGAAREDTLKKICKTSLKMDQAIDCGDVDSYQKLSRVYDAMMKSAKFTEAQNKETKSDFVESVGEMVAYCEKHGGLIPEFKIDVPYDVVDKIIDDLKQWNKSLIYEDKSLADEIEQFLKKKEIAEEMKRDKEEAKDKGLDHVELSDEDYVKFKEAIEADKAQDAELYAGGGDEE